MGAAPHRPSHASGKPERRCLRLPPYPGIPRVSNSASSKTSDKTGN